MELKQELIQEKIGTKGYVFVKIEGKWIKKHRFIVEEFIGRKLTNEEVIHHIDFNKLNNSLNNLQIFDNQKAHSSFHNKLKRFGYHTRPMLRQIEERWNNYI